MTAVTFTSSSDNEIGYVSFNLEYMPFTCGFVVLGEVECHAYRPYNKADIMRAFIEWITNQPIKNNISVVNDDNYEDNLVYDHNNIPKSPLFYSLYQRSGNPLYARVILTDNEKGDYDTRLFAKLANLPEYPWARNPNSGNYVTHWYFDLVDDIK